MAANVSKSGPINTDKIGFFFGAGSSVEIGIPSMKQMTLDFGNQIRRKEGGEEERDVFDLIYSSLEKAYGKDKVDIEAIMSVIVGLKEKEHVKENIGELGLFMLERKGIIDHTIGSEYKTEILDKLENEFKKHVRNKVVIVEPQKNRST